MADNERSVIAQATLTIDGFTAGPDDDNSFLFPHVTSEQMSSYSEGNWRGASTAVMGRTNYEGFHGYWPPVATDPEAPPRQRDIAVWLDTVDKVVFSRTLDEATWQNARVASDVESEIRALKRAPGQHILVLNSASIIQELLRLDLLDELRLHVVPTLLGGGLRLFPDGLPRSDWERTGVFALETGAIALEYRRAR
jgi:dihydrofolate reductase